MIAGWFVYCLGVGGLLCAAAAIVDERLLVARRPSRWVWLAAIVLTIAVPAATYVAQRRPQRFSQGLGVGPGDDIQRLIATHAVAPDEPRSVSAAISERSRIPEFGGADPIVIALALGCTVLALLRVLVDSVLLHRGRRRWAARQVDGIPVLVSDDFGPAIVGLLRYAIVLPRWTLDLSDRERALMLAHEAEHARANDVRLTTSALFLVLCMPWNPAVWYALRRLRTAIEVDCDRRVLRAHTSIADYGHLLVDVAARATGGALAVAGFSERAAPLARRIRAMTAAPARGRRVMHALAAIAVIAVLASCVALRPPTAPARVQEGHEAHRVTPLPKYAGDSIATDTDRMHALVGVATGLPDRFTFVEPKNDEPRGIAAAARCAGRLIDDRDGTTLLMTAGSGGMYGLTQREDTTWTRIVQFGFYRVEPAGRYGVQPGQLLRVGCGGFTRVTIHGREVDVNHDVSRTPDVVARENAIVASLRSELHLTTDVVDLRAHRLTVVVTDSILATGPDSAWVRLAQINRVAERVLGAEPDTLVFTIRVNADQSQTLYHYARQHRPR